MNTSFSLWNLNTYGRVLQPKIKGQIFLIFCQIWLKYHCCTTKKLPLFFFKQHLPTCSSKITIILVHHQMTNLTSESAILKRTELNINLFWKLLVNVPFRLPGKLNRAQLFLNQRIKSFREPSCHHYFYISYRCCN